jgi:hypothetical protein
VEPERDRKTRKASLGSGRLCPVIYIHSIFVRQPEVVLSEQPVQP